MRARSTRQGSHGFKGETLEAGFWFEDSLDSFKDYGRPGNLAQAGGMSRRSAAKESQKRSSIRRRLLA
jgi:hypothetical protein